jgi:hypothetical protein
LPVGGAGAAVEDVDHVALRLTARCERVAGQAGGARRLELEALLTESCTQSYMLETQRLRTKRRMVSALADASPNPTAEDVREEVRELVGRYWSITEELERVAGIIARLRVRLEKMKPT